MEKQNKEIPQSVREYAKKHGYSSMLCYRGRYKEAEVYCEYNEPDENGLVCPTGLPCFILLEKSGKVHGVFGLDALELIGNIK